MENTMLLKTTVETAERTIGIKEIFDIAFEYITKAAYAVSNNPYIEAMGLQKVNPYLLLAVLVTGSYFLLNFLYDILIRKPKFKKNKKELIKQINLTKEIEKEEELIALKKKTRELERLKADLQRDSAYEDKKKIREYDDTLSKEDILKLMLELNKQNNKTKEPAVITKEIIKEVPKEVIKEVIKEVPAKEPRQKTKVKLVPEVKEITVPIPKINFELPEKEQKEEEYYEIDIPNSVLGIDETASNDKNRVIISDEFKDEESEEPIEEIIENNEEDKEENPSDNITEIPDEEDPLEEMLKDEELLLTDEAFDNIDKINEDSIEYEEVEEDDELERLKKEALRKQQHKEEIEEQLKGRG